MAMMVQFTITERENNYILTQKFKEEIVFYVWKLDSISILQRQQRATSFQVLERKSYIFKVKKLHGYAFGKS